MACLCLLLSATGMHAYEERDLLQHLATQEQVKDALVMNQKWVTYPAYEDREGWDKLLGTFKDYYIKRGEGFLKYEWKVVKATDYLEFERSGNRTVMEGPFGANNQAIASLLMAELAEGKGRFTDQLINGVFHTCEMSSWSLSAHNSSQKTRRALPSYDDPVFDLTNGEVANLLSWTYYFMKKEFDKVDPEISRRLRHELQVKVLDTYLHNDTFWWMGRRSKASSQNNWNPWCNSNALIAFMLLENDRDTLATAVWETMRSVDQFLNHIKGDGACEEGPSYWGHAAGKTFDFLEMLSTITQGKVNLLNHKFIRDMGEYIWRTNIGNGWVVNFADASAKGGGDPYLIYRYGKGVDSPGMMHFSRTLFKHIYPPTPAADLYRVLKAIEVKDGLAQTEPENTTAPFTWYPETEFCYLSNDEGLFLAAKGGHNAESHNHNDVGSFNLYMDQKPIIIDVGVGTYTRQTFSSERYDIWTMQSNYHNLPIINGVAEKAGGQYHSRNTTARPNHFATDIAGAYPEEAQVERWTRTYTLKGREAQITDDFSLKETVEPNVVNFMTWGEVKQESEGSVVITADGQKALMTYDASKLTLQIEPHEVDDRRLSNVWGKQVYRLSFKARKTARKGQYKFTIKKV